MSSRSHFGRRFSCLSFSFSLSCSLRFWLIYWLALPQRLFIYLFANGSFGTEVLENSKQQRVNNTKRIYRKGKAMLLRDWGEGFSESGKKYRCEYFIADD